MKKFYIAPEIHVEKIQVESVIALSTINTPAGSNTEVLVKGEADFVETGSGSRGNAWSDQW